MDKKNRIKSSIVLFEIEDPRQITICSISIDKHRRNWKLSHERTKRNRNTFEEKKKTTTHTRVKVQKIRINSKYRGRTTDLRILVRFVKKKKKEREKDEIKQEIEKSQWLVR